MLVSFFLRCGKELFQTEGDHRGLRADVNPAVDDHRGDEFVAAKLPVAALRRVVELVRQIRSVVRMKHTGTAIFDDPNDAVVRSVRGDCGSRTGIAESM